MIDGVDAGTLRETERTKIRNQKIGFVFQFFNLMPELTVLENVMLPGLIKKTETKELKRRAVRYLAAAGLENQVTHGGSELSGGQMQRVAIARALINNPAIVLADEPTGNLDSKNSSYVIDFMHEQNRENNQTFLIVSHAPDMFGNVDKTIYIKDGNVEKIV